MRERGNEGCPEDPVPTGIAGQTVEEQVAEDTCAEHKQFCCPVCFDMTTGTIE